MRFTSPTLSREATEKVLQIIRTDIGDGEVRVDNPTQNLESYFLDVVRRARAAAAETSGATSGNKVAQYLRGDGAQVADDPTRKVLERLTESKSKETASSPAEPERPKVDQSKLSALGKQEPSHSAPEKPAEEEKPAADLSKANEKLSGLLGGKKPKE
jgi:hypothetical protein